MVTLAEKLKMQKNILKPFYHTFQLSYAKNGSKKQPILEKCDHFENCQKWPPSKGYRLCKMVTLAQKLKIKKNMLTTLLQHVAVVLCKKPLHKAANIRKMRPLWKLPQMATKQKLLTLHCGHFRWFFLWRISLEKSLVCVWIHLQNLTLRPWICCWRSGYLWTT